MAFLKNGAIEYLNNKVDKYIDLFGDEKIQIYIEFYDEIPFSTLKSFFSIFHCEFNRLFKYMNSRLNNGHYNADESRDLIFLYEELRTVQANLKNTKFDFDIDTYYKEKLDECDVFLQSSGGSQIPIDFQRINVVESRSIFKLKSSNSITKSDKEISFLTKMIGSGSYASVHKYKDEFYNRFFAIKKAHKNLSEEEYKRFKIEFDEMKKLNSPYVVEVYNFDEVNRQYIMEYVDKTLASYISKNNNKLTLSGRANLVRQILRAFCYINSKGVLHRDISTTNILLKKYEELKVIKVADFGLVKRRDSELTRTNTKLKGSLNDPKLELIGFNKYELRHETYALTRLIYFVITGKSRINSYKNQKFKAFIEKGISDNIKNRYANVNELQEAFNKVILTLY